MASRTAATGEVGSGKSYFDRIAGEGTTIGKIRPHSAVKRVIRIASNPSNIKRACQITYKSIGVYNLMHEVILHPNLVKGLRGVVDVIDFYGTYENIVYFRNAFSKSTLDRKLLAQTLKTSLENSPATKTKEVSEIVNAVMAKVFAQDADYHNAKEVRALLRAALEEEGIKAAEARTIASLKHSGVRIEKRSRSVPELVLKFCFTLGDIVDHAVTLKKYGIVDYTILTAKIAEKMGTASPIFTFIYEAGAGQVIRTLKGLGLIVAISSTSYQLIMVIHQYIRVDEAARKNELLKEMKFLGVRWMVTAIDLAVFSAPIFLSVSPPMLLGMAVFSKAVGLGASAWRSW